MSKITKAFEDGKAFIPFVTAGDPSLDTTKEILHAMVKGGADLIEIGIPFSDPVAEGPVIEAADMRALEAGTTTEKIFDMLREFRAECSTPLVFMTYVNLIYVYGVERFAKECKECDICGVIVPDLPYEEKREIQDILNQYDVEVISLIAPTSKERVKMIAKEAQGFLYCVSSMGVTGMRQKISTNIDGLIQEVKKVNNIPCAIGFGISTPEQAKEMAKGSDGVIVGSAIVNIVAKEGLAAPEAVYQYVKSMKLAIS